MYCFCKKKRKSNKLKKRNNKTLKGKKNFNISLNFSNTVIDFIKKHEKSPAKNIHL